jgi:hypothetical protein
MQETKEHGDAFDEYYAMGDGRSLRSLADHRDVTIRTLARWSKKFNWQERIIQRDLEINKRTEEKTNKAIVNTKADYRADIKENRDSLKTIRQRYEKLIADATEAIEKGEIKATTVKELDSIASSLKKLHDLDKDYVKLDLLLTGEADSHMEISGGKPAFFFGDKINMDDI